MSAPAVAGLSISLAVVTVSYSAALGLVTHVERARIAADSAAIAAAVHVAEGHVEPPCAAATRLSTVNGSTLIACGCDGPNCTVRVATQWLTITLTASARAGVD